ASGSGVADVGRRGDWRAFEDAPLDVPLQAALDAFMEIGYHGATMRDIARRAGLSVPGIYHHYASKQDMLETILDASMDDLIWRYEAAITEAPDTYSRFTNAVECMVLFHTWRRDWGFLGRSEQRSLEGEAAVRAHERRIATERSLIGIVEDGRTEGIFATKQARVSGRAVIMMCVGTVYWFRSDGQDRPEEIARQYVDLALRMVEHTSTP
ncbi:TetR/AcrR family transcriptional regulator, partial [Nocardioides endophyticus]|uniref:TetR/AcrR family transcriptional regulator n=1 Tax=Nocardioides endophyticus TaxID=1353775 RepID=UPI0031EDC202